MSSQRHAGGRSAFGGKAGIQDIKMVHFNLLWIPVFAGMTEKGIPRWSLSRA